MADYLVKAKPPLSFEAEFPLLKILDFGGSAVRYSSLIQPLYVVTNLTFLAFQQGLGEARPPTQSAIGVHTSETVFPMIGRRRSQLGHAVWSLAGHERLALFGLVVECIDLILRV